jgi:hypothetical protein
MADLIFSFQEMLDEVQAMARIGAEFLTRETQEIEIPNLVTVLENIRVARPRTATAWAISTERPIRTVDSVGEYELGERRGAHTVFGELSFVWEIMCPEERGPRSRAQNRFVLCGLSSTRMRVCERSNGGQRELAMWRFEIGNDSSPGCHFHTQIEGERVDPPYPRSLSIPRLPAVAITPMAALEFLLAETFQSRWRRHAAAETADMQRWKPIQKQRLKRLFEWEVQCIDACIGSPWTAFKAHKPAADLFVRT